MRIIRLRRHSSAVFMVAISMCMLLGNSSTVQSQSAGMLPVPSKWKELSPDTWSDGLSYLQAHDRLPEAIFVGQVIDTIAHPQYISSRGVAHCYMDVPVPLKVKLRIIKVLRGSMNQSTVTVTHPMIENPSPFKMNYPYSILQRVRKGELYILAYDPRSKIVDVRGSDQCTQIYRLDDDLIKGFYQQSIWIKDRDQTHGITDACKVVLDLAQSLRSREIAFHAMLAILGEAPLNMRSPLMPPLQKAFLAIAGDRRVSPNIVILGLQSVGIDHSNPKGLSEMDKAVANCLISIMNSPNTILASRASESLYSCLTGSCWQNGKAVQCWYPEIIDALEKRAAVDQSTGVNHGAAGTLSNLNLVGKYPFAELQRNGPVTVRHLPAKTAATLANRR